MEKEEYYLGLDIGTNSVGWAATNKEYKLLRAKGENLWGAYLFDEASTAQKRRLARGQRRRLARQHARINRLQVLFAPLVFLADPNFFIRLNNSRLYLEDKDDRVKSKYALFADKNFTDYDFYHKYKTIYHLQEALLTEDRKFDIREIYLALHHLVKYRGHFLMEGQSFDNQQDLSSIVTLVEEINEFYDDNFSDFGAPIIVENVSEIIKQMTDNRGVSKTSEALAPFFHLEGCSKEKKDFIKAVIGLLSGAKEKISHLLPGEEIDEDVDKISFSDSDFDEEKAPLLEGLLEGNFLPIGNLRKIYSYATMKKIMGESNYVAESMVKRYEEHKKQLNEFKKFIKVYFSHEDYTKMFRVFDDKENNYPRYIGMNKTQKLKHTGSHCSLDDFYTYVKKLLTSKESSDPVFIETRDSILGLLDKNNPGFLLKINNRDNASLPYQLNVIEARQIIKNQSKYYPELLAKSKDSGQSILDRVITLIEFKIPYYVGPLNDQHKGKKNGFAWLVRKPGKEKEQINPYNIDEVVDYGATQTEFIRRMTNKCTYLYEEDVLPANSLLYREYDLLNHVNTITVNNVRISNEQKQLILSKLEEEKKLTPKQIKKMLENMHPGTEVTIGGIDEEEKLSAGSLRNFRLILNERFEKTKKEIEDVILWLTVFDDKETVRRKIREKYSNVFSEDDIKKMARLNYQGWGRFSQQLLVGPDFIIHDEQGEVTSILQLLRATNRNFMEIINDERYGITQAILDYNAQDESNKDSVQQLIDESYVSPMVKRATHNAIKLVEEIVSIKKKNPPTKIFVEVTRGEDKKKKGKKTSSRKNQLLELWKASKKDIIALNNDVLSSQNHAINFEAKISDINEKTERDFRSDRLFLYYLQFGLCMYTGEPIDLSKLNSNLYDIDHIYPQSKIKDDSLNNRVLVKRSANLDKSDVYPIKPEVQSKMKPLWEHLKKSNLISEEKYKRLTRITHLSEDEMERFINRQIVSTSQSIILVANIIKKLYPDTKVVYSKASNVSSFRRDFDLVKVREINDLHHAMDAYLNVVVGNAYDTKYTKNFVQERNFYETLNFADLFKFNIKNAWVSGDKGTITTIKEVNRKISSAKVVKKTMVRFSDGDGKGFYNLKLSPKGENDLFPSKTNVDNPLSNTEKYGGYTGKNMSFFTLVEYENKGSKKRMLASVPIIYAKKALLDDEYLKHTVLEGYYGLNNPIIIRRCIPFHSKLIVNGMPTYLAGVTGSRILLHNGVQLLLNSETAQYVKNLGKLLKLYMGDKPESIIEFFQSKNEIALNEVIDSTTGEIKTKPSYITKERNIEVYDILTQKYNLPIFEGTSHHNYFEKLVVGKEKFSSLNIYTQAIVILEIVKTFQAKSNSGSLELIEQKKAIPISINSNLNSNIILEVTSATGLFKNEIKLN